MAGDGLETRLLPGTEPAPNRWKVERECALFFQGCGCGCGVVGGGNDVFGVKLVLSNGSLRWVPFS